MRLRPRSIRARDTVIAALLAGLVLTLLGVGAYRLIREDVEDDLFDQTQKAGRRVSADLRAGLVAQPIPADPPVRLIQVVDDSGRVVRSSAAAAGLVPLSTKRPSAFFRVIDAIECPAPDGGCYAVELIRTAADPHAPVVISAVPLPPLLGTPLLGLLIAVSVLGLTAAAAWSTWVMVGHTLRPIAAIRGQLSEISASDLSRRVPETPGTDEIAELARTANRTLDRLERSVTRQQQFAQDASHELRTPIAGLRANLEDALMFPEDTDFRETARAALRDTDRLEAIITDLLLLARLGTVADIREDFDLAELAETERRAGTVVEAAGPLPVNGVRVQFARLYRNLLDNAERYGGGEVRVEARRDGPEAVLTVTDQGPGIPAEDRERVFDRFTRLDTARSRGAGGFGLGLAIARDIAVAHGGSLVVEDSPRGARFALRLPLLA